MTLRDYRDLEISGATLAARGAFERALEAHLSWRSGAELLLEQAIRAAPMFTMAHVLRVYLDLCSRDPRRVRRARTGYAAAATLPATPRERWHVSAIGAMLEDDFASFRTILQSLLAAYPRDVLALQIGHALDYLTGDVEGMGARITAVLPAWSKDTPGFHAVLAMQAFSLAESAQYARAAETGHRALELERWDARAHHALTHVHEMTGDAAAGRRWMEERRPYWAAETVAATHLWWHWALFHLAVGDIAAALAAYDDHVRADRSAEIADMIDASALLWRIELLGGDPGERWAELAATWREHIEDAYCTFNDMHAMLALVGARDWAGAARLERALHAHGSRPGRYGETTRLVGLPVGRALIAFGRGDYLGTVRGLRVLPACAHRIGGSHAQRHLLHLTLLEAARQLRRSARSVAA
ncbi:MAG TPA: tetratricopeptide repeat protein [Steroidobacteraceae bacterium]|nr:tetratricopeptide repeat protein [Steroidobacteraceae bacterium]